jgi:hypothetical protein
MVFVSPELRLEIISVDLLILIPLLLATTISMNMSTENEGIA